MTSTATTGGASLDSEVTTVREYPALGGSLDHLSGRSRDDFNGNDRAFGYAAREIGGIAERKTGAVIPNQPVAVVSVRYCHARSDHSLYHYVLYTH